MKRLTGVSLLCIALATTAVHEPIAAAGPALSQDASAALSTYLRDAVTRGDVPGAVVAVVNKDGLVFHEAFGKLNVAGNVTMPKDAIFNIASMTKPVTSVAIMMLVNEGKLKIDDDVAKYLPKFKDPKVITKFNAADGTYDTRPAKRPITIRHLLTHTSGIGYGFSSPTISAIQRQTMQNELDLPLLFDPGEGWAYGASTRVLGDVVEKVSGQRIDAFVEARIFKPLGMRDTAYTVPKDKYSRVVTTHTRADGKLAERPVPATVASNVAGDGGLYSTAADYGLFLRMLLNGGQLGTARILKAGTVRTMFSNHTGNVVVETQQATGPISKSFPLGAGEDKWGLGFQLAMPKTRKANTRSQGSGTWAGIFNTHFWIDPQKEVAVIAMMQLLPFYDDQAMAVLGGIEERVYKGLK
jgi:CubicO group peptidase (beta-lactamase class C family)